MKWSFLFFCIFFVSCASNYKIQECSAPIGIEYLRKENPAVEIEMDSILCTASELTGLSFDIVNRRLTDGCLAFIDLNRAFFKINNPYLEFIRDSIHLDEYVFTQVFDSIPILFSSINFTILDEKTVSSFQGRYYPSPNIASIPLLDTLEARELATFMYESDERMDTLKTRISLVIWHNKYGRANLAWAIKIEGFDRENWLYLVHAISGAYLDRWEIDPFFQ